MMTRNNATAAGELPCAGVVCYSAQPPPGEQTVRRDPLVSGTLTTDHRFTGQRSEEATPGSLYDYNARFYSLLGRFLSADTIVPEPGNPQNLNRYA